MDKKQILHTDNLETKYGSVHCVILLLKFPLRIVNICDSQEITRTHAITLFNPKIRRSKDLREFIQKIDKGELLGLTLRSMGYSLDKRTKALGSTLIPEKIRQIFLSRPEYAVVNIYELWIKKDTVITLLGTVCELMDPDFYSVQRVNLLDKEQTGIAHRFLLNSLSLF